MKRINNISIVGLFVYCLGFMSLTSCKDDLPSPMESAANYTVIKSIKLLNTGAAGTQILEGVVDENKKTISFPRIDPDTDFQNLKFDAVLSDGAKLDKEAYSVAFAEGDAEKTIVIKVNNEPRYREYFVKLRLKIPVFGADFSKVSVFDYSNNELGNPTYASFTAGNVRGSGFNGKYVLVVDRGNGTNPHVLKVEDLKKNIISPIKLNAGAGFIGGTFTTHSGAISGNHIYVANLSGSGASPLNIYHWTDPTAPAQQILNTTTESVVGGSFRFGDNMSVNLDENGNGNISFVDNAGMRVLRYNVTNYTNISNPTFYPTGLANVGSWASLNQVSGTSNFIFTGHQAPVRVVSESGNVLYQATAYPERLSDVRVITFNGSRYLMGITAARTGSDATVFNVYNITKGETITEALQNFDNAGGTATFSFSLAGPVNAYTASTTGWSVIKDAEGADDKLLLYAATADAGFVFFEIPKSKLED